FLQLLERKRRQEFLRRCVIMIAAVGPEELGEFRNFRHRLGIDSLGMRDTFLKQALLLQTISRQLIVKNRVDSNRRLSQPVSQSLLSSRKRREAGSVQLNEGRVAQALDDDVAGFVLIWSFIWSLLAGQWACDG